MVSDIYWLYTCAKKERKEKITMWFWFSFSHWIESDGKISSKPHIVSGFCESKENMIAWNVHKNHVTFRCLHFHQNSKRKKRKNPVQARGMAPYKETECSVYGWYLTLFLKKEKEKHLENGTGNWPCLKYVPPPSSNPTCLCPHLSKSQIFL